MNSLSNWKKPIIIIIIFNFIILSANLIITFFYSDYIKLNLEWILGTKNKTILSNLFFIEGAFTIGIGALIAAGYAENRMPQTRGPAAPYIVDKLSKQRPHFRDKQISTGLLLILAGIPLIIMAIITTLF